MLAVSSPESSFKSRIPHPKLKIDCFVAFRNELETEYVETKVQLLPLKMLVNSKEMC